MLTVEEKENIASGFKVAGERMSTIETNTKEALGELKAATDNINKQLKLYARSMLNASMEAGQYLGFWGSEEHAKSFGEMVLKVLGRKAMGETTLTEGGVLVPDEMATRVIQKLGQYGKFRKNALVVPVGSDRQVLPKVESDLTVYAPGEGQEITESDMVFRQVGLNIVKFSCLCAVSSELEEDSVIALGEILGISISRSMAKKEDLIGFLGDGTSTYFGMTGIVGALLGVSETISEIKGLKVGSGNLYSELTLDDFEGTVAILPEDADDNAQWYCSKKFFYTVMYKLARAAGAADLFAILTDKKERFFMGYPVEFVSAMPSTEANSQVCALLGSLSLGAYLGERKQLSIAKSTDVFFKNDQIGVRGIERVAVTVFGAGDKTEAGPIVGLITAAS